MDITATCTVSHFSYLRVHSVAFKHNVADLNTACYCVKLQGDSKKHLGVRQGGKKILLWSAEDGA